MIGDRLRKGFNRFKNGLIATAFVATQAIPFMAMGVASAAGNPSADLDQCRNGTLASPSQCLDLGGSTGWVNGNAGSSNAHWREGDSIAYRMRFDNLSLASHSVTIQWDTTKGGKHALDYLTTYNRTETTANPCSGVAGCGSPTTFAIPDDPNSSVTQVPGVFTLYNGSITSLSAYSLTGSYASDSSTSITVNFTANTASPVLAWGGHIASQIDWGVGNSASAVSGSPYHMRLLDLDGKGGNQDRSLSADSVFATPTISTQVSSATINTGQTVTDTATLSGSASPLKGTVAFYVCGPSASNPACTTGGTQVGSAVSVSPGTGTAGTAVSAAYTASAAGSYCFRAEFVPAADSPYSPQNHTNLTTECFSAAVQPGSITITKEAVPNSAQDFAFTTSGGLGNFSLDDDADGTLPKSRTFTDLTPGTYTVTETATDGWDLSDLSCSGGTTQVSDSTVTISLTAGANVSCTYTNRQRAQIIVHKVTDPANDPTSFGVTASGGGTIYGSTTGSVSTSSDAVFSVAQNTSDTAYAVSETAQSGWSQASNTCNDLVVNGNSELVNGIPTVTCTITNTKLAKLKILKDAVPDGAQDFAFTASGSVSSNFSLDDDADATLANSQQFTNLTPGIVSVTETAITGWQLTGLSCTGINYTWDGATNILNLNLPAGADVTCTFTNTQLGNISGTKYEADAGASTGTKTLSGWVICLDANNNDVCDPSEANDAQITDANGDYTFSGLLPGVYGLFESLKDGWTQIFSPDDVTLSAGQNSIGNDFGNFENGSISGYKWNDLNGNGMYDNEPKLSGWTIFIDADGDGVKGVNEQSDVTDANGNYSLGNVAPGTYRLCEEKQLGWLPTAPFLTGCYDSIVIDTSGEAEVRNFGNQARGSIQVIKNVDTDGDGDIDVPGATDWIWDINGSGNHPTGTTWGVGGGTYTVSEDQKPNYHVTASSCTDEQDASVSTSKSVTVGPGEAVVCTFTNTRDTGTLRVLKDVDLNGDGDYIDANESGAMDWLWQANGGADHNTGDAAVQVTTGDYALTETNKTDYHFVSLTCEGGSLTNNTVTVTKDANVVCTFKNARDTGTLLVKKNVINDNGGTKTYNDFTFKVNSDAAQDFNADAGDQNGEDGMKSIVVLTGTYSVTEPEEDSMGYSTSYDNCSSVAVTTDQTTICTITNDDDAPGLDITKHVINDNGGTVVSGDFSLYVNGSLLTNPGKGGGEVGDNSVTYRFDDAKAGVEYAVSEDQQTGYKNEGTVCVDDDTLQMVATPVVLSLGQHVTCTITNNDVAPKLTLVKYVTKDNGGTAVPTDFTLSATPEDDQYATLSGAGGASDTVQANVGYDLSETNLFGYNPSGWFCGVGVNLSGSTITLAPGDDITCSITNNDIAPLITVTKTVINDNGGQLQVSSFPLYVDSLQVTSGIQTEISLAGMYLVSEQGSSAYQASSWGGDCDALGNITMVVGGVYSCSITNDDIQPQLTVIKHVVNDNTNLTKKASDFMMNVSGVNVDKPSFAGDENGTTVMLNAGDYTVTEGDHDGYTVSYSGDCSSTGSGSIDIGEEKTCTVTNTAILKPGIHVVKSSSTETAYEGNTVTYTFTVTNTGNTPLDIDSVSDDVAGDGAQLQSGDTNHNNWLEVDETWIYTVDYTIPADSEDITNIVEVCASDVQDQPVCDDDHHTIHVYHPLITVTKYVETSQPNGDDGTFNLQIDGVTKATGDNGVTTGDVLVTPGDHTVGETGANGTDLSDYDKTTLCWIERGSYVGTQTDPTLYSVNVTGDQHVYCAITNTRHAHLTVVKDAVPNDPQLFDFTLERENVCASLQSVQNLVDNSLVDQQCGTYSLVDEFQLQDYTDPTKASKLHSLTAGWYKLTELKTVGWDLTNISCGDVELNINQEDGTVEVYLQPGEDLTCTYTNTKRATVTIVKDARPDSLQLFMFGTTLGHGEDFGLMDDGTSNTSSKTFTDVLPGTYTVTEANVPNWTLSGISCGEGVTTRVSGSELTLVVAPGANITCTFVNERGEVLGAVTPPALVNTGESPLISWIVAGTAIMLSLGAVVLTKRQATKTSGSNY
jgi:hypothetical protein